jgi:uncharacterized protein (DUF1015 family)
MAKIHPFKAIRPTRDKAQLVATRPYYSYKKGVLKAKLQSNPYTFLRIINPEFGLPKEERIANTQLNRFQMVKAKYTEFIKEGILIQDEVPAIYLYRQTVAGHQYTGIISGASVEEYLSDTIKKHEATITAREEMFVEYLDVVEYNAEPVLLCHESSVNLDLAYAQITKTRAEYEFTTTDQVTHEMWLVVDEQMNLIIDHFNEIDALYIADGHHRCASSVGLHKQRLNRNKSQPNDQYFLSFLIDEKKIKIFEYNRLIRLKSSQTLKDIVAKISASFEMKELPDLRTPANEHELVMITLDKQYSIQLNVLNLELNHPVASLDAEILTNQILSPIIGIHDLKTDSSIDFIAGIESIEKVKKKMLKNNFHIAFLLYPVNFEQVKRVADAGMIMPPKSTWVEPKMRSGLTIYQLNESNEL